MKKGFTLIELMAVIAIMAVMALLVVPNIISLFNRSTDDTMAIQETQVLDAGKLYLQDYYFKPMSSSKRQEGISNFKNLETGNDSKKYLCLNVIVDAGYTDEVYFKGILCDGIVIFDKGDNQLYNTGRTYLYCADAYSTSGAEDYKNKCD